MAITSVMQANSTTAEFARLFELFDRVATRRARGLTGNNSSEAISAEDIAAVPAEFAPVLKNLSNILSMRAQRDTDRERCAIAKTYGRPRRNTVAVAPSSEDGSPGVQLLEPSNALETMESPSFPLGERYPFTFKLMLHKLYDLDEWAEKVKSTVEASRSQFKPLAERIQSAVREATRKEKTDKRDVTRSRSHSVLTTGSKPKVPAAPRERAVSAMSSGASDGTRAVKRRCIGRRKSVSGPMATGVWIYDAAISAVEVEGSRPSVEITLSTTKQTQNSALERSRYRSLAGLEGIEARETERITSTITTQKRARELQKRPRQGGYTEDAKDDEVRRSFIRETSSETTSFAIDFDALFCKFSLENSDVVYFELALQSISLARTGTLQQRRRNANS